MKIPSKKKIVVSPLTTKNPSTPSVKSVAPPAFRTAPTTKTVQAKTRIPAAPPVYRPQATPKVLQKKSSPVAVQPANTLVAQRKTPTAPPVYRPQATPKVLQTKKAAHSSITTHRPSSSVQLRPLPQPISSVKANTTPAAGVRSPTTHARPSTIQLAKLVRKPFSNKVRKTLTCKYGEHRRHIIPNHLMKNMLQSWWDCHEDDEDIEDYTSLAELQVQLDTMNNYMPNLVPGPGAANSAIGMISHNIEKHLSDLEEDDATPMEIAASLGTYGGFQQAKQRELMEPVLKAYKKDPEISVSHEEGIELAQDIHLSTNFDWPGGNHFDAWYNVYELFVDIEQNPGNYSMNKLNKAIKRFMSLPSPKS